jgi:hypothetical protein
LSEEIIIELFLWSKNLISDDGAKDIAACIASQKNNLTGLVLKLKYDTINNNLPISVQHWSWNLFHSKIV